MATNSSVTDDGWQLTLQSRTMDANNSSVTDDGWQLTLQSLIHAQKFMESKFLTSASMRVKNDNIIFKFLSTQLIY